jgi:fructan beta-fructosidase
MKIHTSDMIHYLVVFLIAIILVSCSAGEKTSEALQPGKYTEAYRPQLHFTPEAKWMNDPNGMVYHNGEYHLFYQYYPDSTVWGPMHWGHAVSKDLVQWEHLPIALYPDSLGYIFSGSVVVDNDNTTGFGTAGSPALVAIYTYHSVEKERAGRNDYQTQGIAYSVDNGRTWKKYENNPVLKNPGIRDFRDPKVSWHEASGKWVMILAVLDHVELYNSPDLKSWTKLSEFGKTSGAHGGVWECPDLFQLTVEGEAKQKWVMLVSINPGGPNAGSVTQYFVGEFDGKSFKPDDGGLPVKWIDWGQDNYAGVTFSNVPGNRKIFIGWMNNWLYGQITPTEKWRGATTVARDLSLVRINEHLFVKSTAVPEFLAHAEETLQLPDVTVSDSVNLTSQLKFPLGTSVIKGTAESKDFMIELSNAGNQEIKVGYDSREDRFFVDRTNSGNTAFSKDFHGVVSADRYAHKDTISFTVIVDVSSVEVFFDDGVTVMTNLFFADHPMDQLKITAPSGPVSVRQLEIKKLPSIWTPTHP